MSSIDVCPTDDAVLLFTVTQRDRAPWGSTNTTIFVPAADLELLVAKLQASLHAIQERQAAMPAFAPGQYVQVVGHYRHGQQGKVIEVRPREGHLEQRAGEPWKYTVYFADGATWAYNAAELERLP